ncbi:MAG: sensor histidine kinase KdpD [Spirochaetes bacterium]|nr:sensor histidine kinase KdpD [Spirochaetota bacterium]
MNEEYKRPDPDALLREIKEEEKKNSRGRLKIFLGMAPGVGKTYSMLQAARQLKQDSVDVVIGCVETHGRRETESLTDGMEIIPRKKIDYRGVMLEELDIDAVLARKPSVALIDELAHTNAEGSRHVKRYQDVLELIEHGIGVYSTLNIQHLASQADVVEQIIGVKIRETLPDSILDAADEIELVDIPIEELLKRLAEGKVYVPETAGLAVERFFKKGNLTALREMSLHYLAKRVDYDLRDYMRRESIKGPWKTGERLLVAVSPSPYSEHLVRWTRRMAFNLKSPWMALYIEKDKSLGKKDHDRLIRNLNLARELGAEVVSTSDEDIVTGLVRVAQQQNITQIVVGKPLRRYLSDYFMGGNLVERLLKRCGDIDVHIVTQPDISGKSPIFFKRLKPLSTVKEYVIAAASVLLVTLLNLPLVSVTGYWSIGLIYLLGVSMIALLIGRGPVLVAATLSAVTWNYLFIPPLYTFHIAKIHDALMFGMYFVFAIIIGSLTSKLRSKERALRLREERITDLYEFSKALGNALGIDEIVTVAVTYIGKFLSSSVAVILPDGSGGLLQSPHGGCTLDITEKEQMVADWSFKNRRPAGLFTDTIPRSDAHHIPLVAPGSTVGVLCIRPLSGESFKPEQESFLQNIIYQLSVRIERENLSASYQKTRLMEESERLYRVLLNSISHELRTPLTTITGASSSLLDEAVDARPETRRGLSEEIHKAGGRLNRLVDNLLDMSRLESGMLKLNRQRHDLGDLVSVVINRLGNEFASHTVRVSIDEDMPMISIDFTLMEQALANLLYNAVLYTPPGTEITISGCMEGKTATIRVEDNGPGLNIADIPFLFEKFRRGLKATSGGTGLGLSICKGIVEAHGGMIQAGNKPQGGAVFTITIPVEPDDNNPREG